MFMLLGPLSKHQRQNIAGNHFMSISSDHFRNISNLAKFIDVSQDAEETYSYLTQGVCEHSTWDISSIQVLDEVVGRAIPIARYDPKSDNDLAGFEGWDTQISPVAQVLKSGQAIVLPDAASQNEYPGFRDDARTRGYHTTVIIPMAVRDDQKRQMVYSVASRTVLKLEPIDLEFLQCVADLSSIAIRKVRRIQNETEEARRLRTILESMTVSLELTLENEAAGKLATALSGLFPTGWLAVDLTSGRGLFDPDAPPPFTLTHSTRMPDDVIAAALSTKGAAFGDVRQMRLQGIDIHVQASALTIDASHVGALFIFHTPELSEHEIIAAQAGRLALSSFILRNFVEFKSRRTTSRRLLNRLIAQDWSDFEDIQDEAHQLDFDLTEPCRILVLRSAQMKAFEDSTQSFILRACQQKLGPTVLSVVNGDLVMLVSSNEPLNSKEMRSAFLSRIQPLLPSDALMILSEPLEDITKLSKDYKTCVSTLELSGAMGGTGWVSTTDIGAFPVLMASAEGERISDFLEQVLQPISGKSVEKFHVAVETIEAFLGAGRRYQDAADKLNIHVSTLRYRLEQLSEQAGIDFDDPNRCFELDLAIRLLNFKKSYKT